MVNIVVVCWNAVEYTKNTLSSLEGSLKDYSNCQVTIINNGSVDGTKDYLNFFKKDTRLKCKIINNKCNIGIGAAYNLGQKESEKIHAKYTVFCNNDLLFSKNWLEKMYQAMEDDPAIAMLAPIVPSSFNYYDENRTIKEVLLNIQSVKTPEEELKLFLGKFRNIDEFQSQVCDINTRKYGCLLRYISFPNAVSSCIVMTKTSVFKNMVFFANPLFKEYGGEDIDICWRVLDRGYRIAIINNTYIHHFRGKSIKMANLDRVALLKKSNQKLFDLWAGDIANYYKKIGVTRASEISKEPENWLINEIIKDVNIDEILK